MIDYEGLQKHREQTKKDILKLLEINDRVACVRPTGYGKSHLIAQLCNELSGNKLVLEPGLAIINYMEKFNIDTPNTSYITYHSLLNPKVEDLVKEFKDYDYIFLDEMHRALAEKWGKKLAQILEKLTDVKILGFSATPLRSDNRNAVEEIFDGCQVKPYFLEDAILDEYLPMVNYHSSIYEITDEQKRKLRLKDTPIANQILNYNIDEGVSNIFKENLDLYKPHKIICFVDKISNINEAVENIRKWFKVPINIYKVHSKQASSINNKQIENFQNETGLNVIFAVNILNEGVHIPKVDCVIFLRKTSSNILYNQQLGRVIADYNEEPIVFDLVNNIDNLNNSYSAIFNSTANRLGIKVEQLTTKNGKHLKITTHQVDLIEKLKSLSIYVTEEEKQFILDNYKTMTKKELVKALNRDYSTIRRWMINLGLEYTARKRFITEEEKQFILDNYKTMNIAEIAKELNRDYKFIKKFLVNNNLTPKRYRMHFTEEEKQFILDNYKTMTNIEIAEKLGRTKNTIDTLKYKLGITKKCNTLSNATEEEKQFILDNYKTITSKEMAKKLNKTEYSINVIRRNLGLAKRKKFTEEEKQFILDNYKTMTSKEIAEKLDSSVITINQYKRKFKEAENA